MQCVQFQMEASAAPVGQASNQSRLLSAFQVSTSCGLAAQAATNAANCLSGSLPINRTVHKRSCGCSLRDCTLPEGSSLTEAHHEPAEWTPNVTQVSLQTNRQV